MKVAVLVPAGPPEPARERALRWVTEWWAHHYPTFDVVVERHLSDPYCKAAAVNDARARTDADVLVIADGDVWPDRARFDELVAAAAGGAWGWPWDRFVRLNDYTSQRITTEAGSAPCAPDGAVGTTPAGVERVGPAHPGGLLVVPAEAFDAVAGMDERFVGWGGEDNAFAHSVTRMWGPWTRLAGPCWHLWHPPQPTRSDVASRDRNRALYHRYRDARTAAATALLVGERPPRSAA